MSWKESDVMEERDRFVREWERNGVTFSDLCDEYGISRTTGYKWLRRYQSEGVEGLRDLSRRPLNSPTNTPAEMVEKIVEQRARHPSWGGRKIARRLTVMGVEGVPQPSTVNNVLRRLGLARTQMRRRRPARPGRPTTIVSAPNDLWAADFKGQFLMRNGQYCYPLTVTDQFSRYLLACKALDSTEHVSSYSVFERLFREYGLPQAIRTDNGSPFASNGLARLSRLSVYWIKLGIHPELIELGSPQQNGCHERMHRTLKAEATRPPQINLNIQQRCFNRFRSIFNTERPHEALKMETPQSVYKPSRRCYPKRLPEPQYPAHFQVRYVSANGGIRWNCEWINVSSVLVGEHVGFEPVDEAIWSVYFFDYLIARFNERTMRLEELPTPACRIVASKRQ